jgi:hypothetical protein
MKCGKINEDHSTMCYACGASLKKKPKKRKAKKK